MQKKTIKIANKLGLHARASAKLTQTAGRFASSVWISREGRRVNAKSIMGVMLLAAGQGTPVMVRIEGEGEAEAMDAVASLFERRFDEET